jgi:hypothetical protein
VEALGVIEQFRAIGRSPEDLVKEKPDSRLDAKPC